ncbi:molybdopterin-guanine dinucleotide biosynthesis protein B [Candidatus Bipolaricaulota bacterium]
MIPAVAIIGRHDSGKTLLIADLIPALVSRGLHVGTVKHSPHLDDLDAPGSDSGRHFAAGAKHVLLRGAHTSAFFWRHDPGPLSAEIDRLFPDCDLVLVEGGKGVPYPKIEVFRLGNDLTEEPLAGEIDVACVVTDDRIALPDGVAVLPTHDLDAIADRVEALAFGDDPAT